MLKFDDIELIAVLNCWKAARVDVAGEPEWLKDIYAEKLHDALDVLLDEAEKQGWKP